MYVMYKSEKKKWVNTNLLKNQVMYKIWKGKVMYKPERENVNINLWKNSGKYSPVKERVIKPEEKYTLCTNLERKR